jgi:hypothetical protein
MIQSRRCLSLALEPFATILILTQVRWQKLQRDFSIKLGILGQIDFTHSTRTNLFDNLVVRNQGAGGQGSERLSRIIGSLVGRHRSKSSFANVRFSINGKLLHFATHNDVFSGDRSA